MTVTVMLLGASVAIMAAASVGRLQGSGTRELTIAIVDSERTSPGRNQFRAEMAALLNANLQETCGVPIHSVFVGSRDAKQKLNGGEYDAALVIGNDRPFWLRRMGQTALAGSVATSNGYQPVSLIVTNRDRVLHDRLESAFAHLLGGTTVPRTAVRNVTVASMTD
jgi:hypothetical protein